MKFAHHDTKTAGLPCMSRCFGSTPRILKLRHYRVRKNLHDLRVLRGEVSFIVQFWKIMRFESAVARAITAPGGKT